MNKEKRRTYIIPRNFAEQSKIHELYIRNIVEAVILTVLLFQIEKQLLINFDMTLKIIVILITCGPLLVIGAIGIRGYSLLQYSMIFVGYLRSKRKLRYRKIVKRATREEMKEFLSQSNLSNFFIRLIPTKSTDDSANINQSKKRNQTDELLKKSAKALEEIIPEGARTNKSNQKFTQEAIPIKEVRNGIILTRDNAFIKIVEVKASNIQGLTDDDINAIGHAYEGYIKISPNNLHIKIISQKKIEHEYLDKIDQRIKEETYSQCKEMGMDNLRYIKQLTKESGISHRAFVIFRFEKIATKANFEEAYTELNKNAMEMSHQLRNSKNKVVDTIDNSNDLFTYTVLYELLNRKSSGTESFKNRYRRIRADTAKALGMDERFVNDKLIKPVNLIAPRGIDLRYPDYLITDKQYVTYLAINASTYPQVVYLSWTNYLINSGDGYDIDIFSEKEDPIAVKKKIEKRSAINQVNMNDSAGKASKQIFFQDLIETGQIVSQHINAGESLYQTVVMITITAPTRSILEERKMFMKNRLTVEDIECVEFKHQMEDCYISTLPLNKIERTIFHKNKRNMLTQSLASMYPFSSYELADKTGVVLGITGNGSLAYMNLFNTNELNNANMFLIGQPGAGKTYTLLTILTRMRLMGIKCILIAPYKGHEFKEICDALGGSFIRLSPNTKDCINIMDIRVLENAVSNYGEDDERNPLIEKIEQIIDFIKLIYKDLNITDRDVLDQVITETYLQKGIDLHNKDSIYLNGKNGAFKTVPILGDLFDNLMKRKDEVSDGLLLALRRYVSGGNRKYNNQTNVDVNNMFTVIDVSELTDVNLSVGMYLAITYATEIAEADRSENIMLGIDESWRVLRSEADESGVVGDYIQKTVKIYRGLGGSTLFSTQDIKDYMKNDKAKAIVSNCATKMILKLEKDEALLSQKVLNITDEEVGQIQKLEQGNGLLITGNNRVYLRIYASPKQHEYFTTKADEIKAIRKKRQENKNYERELI